MNAYAALRPLLFRLPPEAAHAATLRLARVLPAAAAPDARLAVRVAGLEWPSPVGLAAGFDKDAVACRDMLRLGFGFAEAGTLTPRAQAGNPRPRVFRLGEDSGVVNRLGFNNGGLAAALPRLRAEPRLGVNVGANKDSADRIADYAAGVRAVRDRAGWITLNISSPNTPGLRALQGEALPELLAAAMEARGAAPSPAAEPRRPAGPPVFLKVAPDLDDEQMDGVADAVLAAGVSALIIGNTTVSRPAGLRSGHAGEAGGLSGAPLATLARAKLAGFARRLGGRVPLIAAGGIASGAEAYARLRLGASAVQLYTGLVYGGPYLAARINAELSGLLKRDGARAAEVVGLDLR